MKRPTSYSRKLDEESATKLQSLLDEKGYRFYQVPYARYAAEKEGVKVIYYESGKLVVQGKGTGDFIEFVLEPEILGEARYGYEAYWNPELLQPRIGVDESGKGDFFGPLCVAGVYVNESIVKRWEEEGIRDSKNIGSDRRVAELAELVRQTPGCVWTVVPIGNEAYNRLYQKLKSVNAILAWGHARVIENLLQKKNQMNPPPERAISDQFARSKGTVSDALMALGKEIELVQRHKAEEDPAVAGASILARNEFLERLKRLQREHGLSFPKGASNAVDQAALEFVRQFGFEKLRTVAKIHFRTAEKARVAAESP